MVFAPAPQLTVTIEQQAGEVELHVHPGSQGIWQARMVVALGVPVTLCVTAGGETGEIIKRLLEQEDLHVRSVARESGSGWYVHDRRDGSRSAIAEHPGAPLVRHDLDELYTLTLAEGLKAPVSLLSGAAGPEVVDPDVYRRLACDLGAHGSKVVADLSGEHLNAVLAGGLAFVKVSHEELLDDGRAEEDTVEALVEAARKLRSEGAGSVLISRADQPAIALIDNKPIEVKVPSLQVVDHRGAGDSMTAGVAAVLSRGGDLEEALRTGAAAGALNVTRHGLGTGRGEAVEQLMKRVELNPIKS